MNERPKTPIELANELILKSNPREMMKDKGKGNSSPLADVMEKTTENRPPYRIF
jgi:hypothetical protein